MESLLSFSGDVTALLQSCFILQSFQQWCNWRNTTKR